jgi:hypothetical protein
LTLDLIETLRDLFNDIMTFLFKDDLDGPITAQRLLDLRHSGVDKDEKS